MSLTKLLARFRAWFRTVDVRVTNWMARYGIVVMRLGLGLVFLWFGVLKFFPGLSPAQELATRTISTITFGLVGPSLSLPVLAAWETAIGIGLLTGKFMRITLLLLFLQMIGTVMPLVLFPSEVFTQFPIAPTLEGQYIVKNVVLIGAGLVLGATVRGGAVVADPELAKVAREKESRQNQEPLSAS
jgi:uncharacterized membrane protein YphA (DoxX/SURF4 family)